MSTRDMRIGEVAQRTGLSLPTIRSYTASGLIAAHIPEGETPPGYTETDIGRLLLLKDVWPLQFSVIELENMLAILDVLRRGRVLPAYRLALLKRLGLYRHIVTLRRRQLLDELAALERIGRQLDDQFNA